MLTKIENIKKIISEIKQNCVSVIPQDELEKKLQSGKKLKVKLGADPTAPDLHLGHTIVLSKLKQLQDLGHEIIFLIGDFTALIGDPTGKSKTRPPLSQEQIKENTKTYFEQVGKIIDIKNATIVYNSSWLSQLSSVDMVNLLSKVTVARVIEREDFAKRIENNATISMHELLYPLFQGYDSVVLDADIEIGGTDQTFNMLMGRFLQTQFQKEPQIILTLPILEGINGTEKMSKSLGNAISLGESAQNAFAKLMSISDHLMFHYAELLLLYSKETISNLQERIAGETLHPMEQKKEIAYEIVKKFWSITETNEAQKSFESMVQHKEFTHAQKIEVAHKENTEIWIVELLKLIGAIKTSSEAKRLIESNAVEIDGILIDDFSSKIICKNGIKLRVGKHKFYIIEFKK
jgi:tyrosyl-tRNA synthetase